jgi:SAM-dependent methyltransferase
MVVLKKLKDMIIKTRKFTNDNLKRVAGRTHDKKILELGSGKEYKGHYYYSAKRYFDEYNDFMQTDIDPTFEHPILDITKSTYKDEFDMILMCNVLEHIYDYKLAITKSYEALKDNGTLIVVVPYFYPIHDEPHDYNRFTKYKLFKLFEDQFDIVDFREYGWHKKIPFSYFIELRKK